MKLVFVAQCADTLALGLKIDQLTIGRSLQLNIVLYLLLSMRNRYDISALLLFDRQIVLLLHPHLATKLAELSNTVTKPVINISLRMVLG